ncbi:MAG: ABC-2 transporter permease, partial [Lachnospiraceae bacterium]|nr:ABC-2 transporter permease [Lachnospiraceae bacterium]
LTTIHREVMNLISWLVHAVKGEETGFWQFFLMLAVSLPLAYLMLALEVPLQIKFGREKSRIVTVVLIGVMSAGMGMIGSLSEFSGIDDAAIRGGFASLGVEGISLLVAAVLAALLLLSYRISCRMMEKKEF